MKKWKVLFLDEKEAKIPVGQRKKFCIGILAHTHMYKLNENTLNRTRKCFNISMCLCYLSFIIFFNHHVKKKPESAAAADATIFVPILLTMNVYARFCIVHNDFVSGCGCACVIWRIRNIQESNFAKKKIKSFKRKDRDREKNLQKVVRTHSYIDIANQQTVGQTDRQNKRKIEMASKTVKFTSARLLLFKKASIDRKLDQQLHMV